MKKVKWLHISDIHMNKRGVDNQRMREKLIEFLIKENITCNYVFVTGDLRYAPEGQFAPNTVNYLHQICDAVGVTVKNLFLVPGNHDIERENEDRNQAIESICGVHGYYDSKNGVIKDEDICKLKQGKDGFITIIEELYKDYPERVLSYKSSKSIHFNVETEEFNIVHLDSTITYMKEKQRDFIIGTEQLMDALSKLNPDKATILLSHYSSDFLLRNEMRVVLDLLIDHNVQLWIAGHEHDELLRKQQDYFFEFQCGSLIHEDKGTKSCISIGEYNVENHSGSVKIYYWDSPEGWALYPFSSRQIDRSQYQFELLDSSVTQKQIEHIVSSEDYRQISEDTYVFNISEMTPEKVRNLQNLKFIEMENELGPRLAGNESDEEIIQMFLTEIKSSWNSQKRYDCMPLFQHVIRDVFDCYLYLDGDFAPFLKATVYLFYYNEIDCFHIDSGTFQLILMMINNEVASISFEYNLSYYETVEERLMHFKIINRYLSSKTVFIKMVDHEQYNLSYNTELPSQDWIENIDRTNFWIDQMRRIAQIEQFYNIKFRLPANASEEDFLAIEVLSNSIEKKSSRTLPALPMKNPSFRKKIYLDDEIYVDNGRFLPALNLFGYVFIPVSEYILPGEYYWNKWKKGWESRNNKAGGIPVRVEFEISYKEDQNRELVKRIPFEEIESEFSNKEIVHITGDDAEFFERYVKVTHDFQEIWQLYLSYKNQLEKMQEYDLINIHDWQRRDSTRKITDKITANELTNNVIFSGEMLIEHIDKLMEYVGNGKMDIFSVSWISENIVYSWFTAMRQYSMQGHFPISVGTDGWCYYDLMSIDYEINSDDDEDLKTLFAMFKETFKEAGLNTPKLQHYDLMRNYLFNIAEKMAKYYKLIELVLKKYTEDMSNILAEHPKLIIEEGSLKNHVVYMLNNEDELHTFYKDADIMMDYYKFSKEAENHLRVCSYGMKESL